MSTRVETALFGPDAPITKSLTIEIAKVPGARDELRVTLFVPLDSTRADERDALQHFGQDGDLNVQYQVEMNLSAERRKLWDTINEVYDKHPALRPRTPAPLIRLDDLAMRAAFTRIAVQGHSVFRRLFRFDRFDDYGEEDGAVVARALSSALRRQHLIVIRSPVSLFPWAFLYDDGDVDETDQTTLRVDRFWGFRHQIQEEIKGVSKGRLLPRAPSILAAVDDLLDPTEHKNGPLGAAGGRVSWASSAAELKASLKACDADCIYFYGHASHDDPPIPTTSWIELQRSKITVESLDRKGALRLTKRPIFVFLNGCNTAPLNKWDKGSMAGYFCLSTDNRVCCLATFGKVAIAFGPPFARVFWEAFLAGATLGEALLAARAHMLAEYNNPLGLLYAVYGRVEMRLSEP